MIKDDYLVWFPFLGNKNIPESMYKTNVECTVRYISWKAILEKNKDAQNNLER